jgi:signal transduction histidine kinase
VVAVHDRGIGIPAEELAHVFERFWRSRNAASITGSGVGLAGARHIVELHGGAISVESREHEGSTFVVRLPLTGAARESGALMPSGAFSASR